MHHDLNPPVAHSNLNSGAIYLTDDYAAKVNFLFNILIAFIKFWSLCNAFSFSLVLSQIAEISFWTDAATKSKTSGEDDKEHSELPPFADPETNVYSFGILLLEIISGKLQYSEEQGHLVNWVSCDLV